MIFVHEQNRVIKKLELKKQTNLASTKDTSENLIAEKSNSKDYIFHKVKKGERGQTLHNNIGCFTPTLTPSHSVHKH